MKHSILILLALNLTAAAPWLSSRTLGGPSIRMLTAVSPSEAYSVTQEPSEPSADSIHFSLEHNSWIALSAESSPQRPLFSSVLTMTPLT